MDFFEITLIKDLLTLKNSSANCINLQCCLHRNLREVLELYQQLLF